MDLNYKDKVEESDKPRYTVLVTIKVIEETTQRCIEYHGVAHKSKIENVQYGNQAIRDIGYNELGRTPSKIEMTFALDGYITGAKAYKLMNELPPDRFDFIGEDDEI